MQWIVFQAMHDIKEEGRKKDGQIEIFHVWLSQPCKGQQSFQKCI